MEKRCRFIVAEDHALVRESLAGMLASALGLGEVGVAADGVETVRQVHRHKPDVVIMDLSMPRMNGTEAIRKIKEVHAPVKVVVLTAHHGESWLLEALRAGADAYLVKEARFEELLTAVRSVLQGYRYLSPQVCGPVLEGYLRSREEGAPELSAFDLLSPRERQVLKLVAEGRTIRAIADLMNLSPKTVEKARTSLAKKLGLHTIPALTAYAIEKGLVVR